MEAGGTGFMVGHRNPRSPGRKDLVMVTTAHVLEQAGKEPVFMAVRMPEIEGLQPLALLRLETGESGRLRFARHPKHDVAAFIVEVPPEIAGDIVKPTSFSEEAISKADELSAGRDLAFAGFPEVFPGTPGGYPILRSGKIASHMIDEVRREQTFVMNADVYPGDSGSPVFGLDARGKLSVEGMVIERIAATSEAFSHFAVAVDARAIRETLALLDRQLKGDGKRDENKSREQKEERLPEHPGQADQQVAIAIRSRWLYPLDAKTGIKGRQASSLGPKSIARDAAKPKQAEAAAK
jgi:hypothetical protein